MKIPGKNIKGLDPAMRADEAARVVLSARLDAVRMLLPLAAHEWQEDVEHVHQLRVATRRASSAMAAFDACLDSKRAKKVGSLLKRLRKSAGAARDADVHAHLFDGLFDQVSAEEQAAIKRVQAQLMAERAEAQPRLVKVAKDIPIEKLDKRFSKLLDSIGTQDDMPGALSELAGESLAPHGTAVRAAAAGRPWTIARMHEVRIECKKLRYACEVFTCCLDEGTAVEFKREFVPLLDALGDLNDSDNMVARLRSSEQGAGTEALLARLEAERDRRLRLASDALGVMLGSDFLDRLTGGRPEMARSA